MLNGRTRKIVVIKDIPSNVIEEAILILKSDPDTRVPAAKEAASKAVKKNDDGYLLKEAEAVINSYIKENKVQDVIKQGMKLKQGRISGKFITNAIINLALVGSIALLIYIIMRII